MCQFAPLSLPASRGLPHLKPTSCKRALLSSVNMLVNISPPRALGPWPRLSVLQMHTKPTSDRSRGNTPTRSGGGCLQSRIHASVACVNSGRLLPPCTLAHKATEKVSHLGTVRPRRTRGVSRFLSSLRDTNVPGAMGPGWGRDAGTECGLENWDASPLSPHDSTLMDRTQLCAAYHPSVPIFFF